MFRLVVGEKMDGRAVPLRAFAGGLRTRLLRATGPTVRGAVALRARGGARVHEPIPGNQEIGQPHEKQIDQCRIEMFILLGIGTNYLQRTNIK